MECAGCETSGWNGGTLPYPDEGAGCETSGWNGGALPLSGQPATAHAALRWCVRTPYAMDSKELSSILDCFGDKKAIKTPKLNTI